jgi:hypothetical protein
MFNNNYLLILIIDCLIKMKKQQTFTAILISNGEKTRINFLPV